MTSRVRGSSRVVEGTTVPVTIPANVARRKPERRRFSSAALDPRSQLPTIRVARFPYIRIGSGFLNHGADAWKGRSAPKAIWRQTPRSCHPKSHVAKAVWRTSSAQKNGWRRVAMLLFFFPFRGVFEERRWTFCEDPAIRVAHLLVVRLSVRCGSAVARG